LNITRILKNIRFFDLKDFTPKLDQKGLKEQYGEIITRFLSGETSIRRLHSKEIAEKLSNDLSYYDEDLFLASTEGVFILGCEDYIKDLRELLELASHFSFCSSFMTRRSMLRSQTL